MGLLARGVQLGLSRWVVKGSRAWIWVWVGTAGLKALKRLSTPQADVARIDLGPGQAVEIRHYRRGQDPGGQSSGGQSSGGRPRGLPSPGGQQEEAPPPPQRRASAPADSASPTRGRSRRRRRGN